MKRLHWLPALLLALLTGCTPASDTQVLPQPEPPQASPAASVPPAELHSQAMALMARADYKGAESLLDQALTSDPSDADAWNDMSSVQANLAKWPEAVQSAQKALALKPGMVYAQYNLGWALLHTDGWVTAIAPLSDAVRGEPDRPEPYVAVGQWYYMAADLRQAELYYARADEMGYEPARKLLADVRAEAAAPWNAVVAGTPNGVPVPADRVASQKAGKTLVETVRLDDRSSAELYVDSSQTKLLVVLSNGPGYAMQRSLSGEPASPHMIRISTPAGTHLLVTGEDPRMTEAWVLVPHQTQLTNALHARMDLGISVQGDAVKLSYRKYQHDGGYVAQASRWRYDPGSGKYRTDTANQPGTQVVTSSGLCNSLPAYLPLVNQPEGLISYKGLPGRWIHITVTGGPFVTERGVRVGDTEQRVTELYGASTDGLYHDKPPYGHTRFTFSNGVVVSFTVICDNTVGGTPGK